MTKEEKQTKKKIEEENIAEAEKKVAEAKTRDKHTEEQVEKEEPKKPGEKKEKIQKAKSEPANPKTKKTISFVYAKNIPISTKYSGYICKFIKGKRIQNAINNLQEVVKMKKAVPMKGEIPHRKGKIMSGRYPVRASTQFITLLKSLIANSNYNGLEDPVIVEATANIGERPYSKFGSVRRKRTHIKIIAKDSHKINEEKTEEK